MARFVPENKKLAIILGASIGVHMVIAVMALLGDPIVERPTLAATSGRIFIPDDVEAQLVIDPTTMPQVAKPAPIAPPAPTPPSPIVQPPAPAHHAQHAQLATPDPKHVIDGLFADHDSLAVNQRKPSADLQQQIDEAHRHASAATIGNPSDLRDPTDTQPRLGTGMPCACDPPRTGEIARRDPTIEHLPPPVLHVDRAPTIPSTLTPDELLRIIQDTYMAGLERCQRELARKTGDASGKVDLELTIDGDGATASVAADGIDDGLDRCIEARAGGWHFPAPHDVKTGDAISARYRVSLALQAK
jgi:hypothetical protein